MFRNTRSRWATLTSGALVAGGLVVAPAVAGLSTASAAPVSLGYTCTIVGGGFTVPLDSTITLDLTVPESVAPGASAPVTVASTIDMGSTSFGPITDLAGTFTIPLTVGGTTVELKTASASAPVTALEYTSTTSGNLTAPAEAGAAPITVGTIVGSLKTTPFDAAAPATCVPDEGQDQTVGALTVDGDAEPEPSGLRYTCTVTGGGFTIPMETTVELDVDLPATAEAGRELPVELDAVIDMGEAAMGPINELSGTFDVPLTVGDVTSVVTTGSSSAPASGLAFATSGSGTVTAPAQVGTAPVSVGTITGHLTTTPFNQTLEVPCVPADGQDLTVGSVDVEKAAPVAVPVTGKVQVSGTPKVGKTLKAVPAKAAGAKVAYQWLANGKAIKKATKASLKLTKALKGKKVAVKVTYTKAGYLDVVQTSKAVKVKK